MTGIFFSGCTPALEMEEIRRFGWSAAQQEAFLRMQFNAQQQWYQATYSTAENQIIEKDHEPIGRMIVQHEARHMAASGYFLVA